VGGFFIYYKFFKKKPDPTMKCSDYTDSNSCTSNACTWDGTSCNDKPSGGDKCPSSCAGDTDCDIEGCNLNFCVNSTCKSVNPAACPSYCGNDIDCSKTNHVDCDLNHCDTDVNKCIQNPMKKCKTKCDPKDVNSCQDGQDKCDSLTCNSSGVCVSAQPSGSNVFADGKFQASFVRRVCTPNDNCKRYKYYIKNPNYWYKEAGAQTLTGPLHLKDLIPLNNDILNNITAMYNSSTVSDDSLYWETIDDINVINVIYKDKTGLTISESGKNNPDGILKSRIDLTNKKDYTYPITDSNFSVGSAAYDYRDNTAYFFETKNGTPGKILRVQEGNTTAVELDSTDDMYDIYKNLNNITAANFGKATDKDYYHWFADGKYIRKRWGDHGVSTSYDLSDF